MQKFRKVFAFVAVLTSLGLLFITLPGAARGALLPSTASELETECEIADDWVGPAGGSPPINYDPPINNLGLVLLVCVGGAALGAWAAY